MDAETAALAAAIGGRVRRERDSRRWTLDRLAEAAGVSRRMVVNVEQGSANPSVGTLLRISGALGVSLATLVEAPEDSMFTIIRAGNAPALWTGEAGGQGRLLAALETPDIVEMWDWALAPHETYASEAHAPGTREVLHVHAGTVTVEVAGRSATLHPGDALAYAGDAPHSCANPGDDEARYTLTVFEPRTSPARSEPCHA